MGSVLFRFLLTSTCNRMLAKKLKNNKIILGSASPRRQELLRLLGVDFEIRISKTDEVFQETFSSNKIATFLAIQKSKALTKTIKENEILITADTIVAKASKILNKPKNKEEAFEMLSFLSDDVHEVITGVCIADNDKKDVFSVTTKVYFKQLSEDEIHYYIKTYKPFDKAGAYVIQ